VASDAHLASRSPVSDSGRHRSFSIDLSAFAGFCWGNGLIVEGELFDPKRVMGFAAFRAVAGGYTDIMRTPLLRWSQPHSCRRRSP
jgi:hypothetical protein